MKHNVMMLIGCILPLLIIFLLPAMGIEGRWIIWLALALMVGCHLMHMGRHKHGNDNNQDHEH